jgi:hypothetical protein
MTLTWDATGPWWGGLAAYPNGNYYCIVQSYWQHPGSTYDSVRTFRCPASGTLRIDSVPRDAHVWSGGDGVSTRILLNQSTVQDWSTVPETGQAVPWSGIVDVSSGDEINFQLNCNSNNGADSTEWNPILTYVSGQGVAGPADADNDGQPDYLEDRNGNGAVDSGETDWRSASDIGLKVRITQPRANDRPL